MHEKCGYSEEGVKRKAVFKNGQYQDQILVSILKDDFQK